MVKPVVMDFDFKAQSSHTNKVSEPVTPFISILKETVHNNSETPYLANTKNNDYGIHNDSNYDATRAIDNKNDKNEKEANFNITLNLSQATDRKIADRRNSQKDDGAVQKSDVLQSLVSSLLLTNNSRAIVTDKNIPSAKQNEFKKDVHTRIFPDTSAKPEKFTINDSLTKKVGRESIQDVINQLQKAIDNNSKGKDTKSSDITRLIANLTTLQNAGKKDVLSAQIVPHVVHRNELSDNKNKKVESKSTHDNHLMAFGARSQKTERNSETTIIDAVKQKGKLEEAQPLDKKTPNITERNDSFIQVNNKQLNGTVGATQAKPLVNDELMQLLHKAKVMQEGERTSLTLKLHPESLGKLSVNLGLENGIISGRFIVESQEAKELLQQQLEAIRFELEQSGVHVGDFEVNVKQQRQRDFSEIQATGLHYSENTEYEEASSRYMYHDGVLDVII
ncbi:MAG: flagellar hook-length control protein FliK [Spirochaetes bacterium]|nr:flagellar hook-length control protein FliK [Spirochaetota bacterium]